MKKLLSLVMLLTMALGFSARAYTCPENLYFYVSQESSHPFTKNQTSFTCTVDASAEDVYGVIVDFNATSWDEAQSHNAYFANGKYGDISVNSAEVWSSVAEWSGSANNKWSNGCYKFEKGNKYVITLVHANGTFTGNVAIEGQQGETPVQSAFDTNKDYYIDASACSWFFDGDAVIKVWDGANDVVCEAVTGSIIKFRPTAPGTNGLVYVKRTNPNDGTTWNEYALVAPANESDNMFAINSSFNGGSWSVYATPSAWIISKGVNNWSAAAISEYKFAYDEATGIYTVSVPADKLRTETAEDNGFKIGYGALNDWNNYYGAVIENKVMGRGVATDAVKNGKNFIIPTSATNPVTLTFDPKSGKLTADWTISGEGPVTPVNPEDSDDVLSINLPKMDSNGSITVEVTLNSAVNKEYCSAQWDIIVPEGFTVSDITLNKERCTDHELVTNVVDGVTKCLVYSANNTPFVRVNRPLFSFTLTAEGVAVGDLTGSLSNILFNVPPVDGNLSIASKFADTPLNISIVKAVSKITANPANLTMARGQSETITLAIEPADATDKTVTWEVISGENIIELAEGTVTAKASGIATIKVTANDGFGATALIDVTIDGKKVENVEISATEHTMYIGEEVQLTATVTPDDASNKGIMWVSSDDNVAIVDETGHVTGISAGEATIHAVAKGGDGVEASCVVTIKAKVSGDADGDDVLTIADIVIIAKKVVGIETEGALFENMDMDRDEKITSTDVTLAVYYLNQQEITEVPQNALMTYNMLQAEDPIAMNAVEVNVPLYLENANEVAGIQFDIVVPDGIEVTNASYVAPQASAGHVMTTTYIGDNTYRVVAYSAYNFKSSSIGYLNMRSKNATTGSAKVGINNVMYSDGNILLATPDSRVSIDISTGVDALYADADARYDVYNTNGVLVIANADKAAVKALPSGIYVVGNTKLMVF